MDDYSIEDYSIDDDTFHNGGYYLADLPIYITGGMIDNDDDADIDVDYHSEYLQTGGNEVLEETKLEEKIEDQKIEENISSPFLTDEDNTIALADWVKDLRLILKDYI